MRELYADIALNLPVDSLFTYRVPDHLADKVLPGKRVLAGFGKKVITGIIMGIKHFTPMENVKDLRAVIDDESMIPEELMTFCNWISEYYVAPIGEVMFSAIPRNINIKSESYYSLEEDYCEKLDKARFDDELNMEIITVIENNPYPGFTKRQLERKFNTKDLSKQLRQLTDEKIVRADSYYSRPTQPKYATFVLKNFDEEKIDSIIEENKIKSSRMIEALKVFSKVNEFDLSGIKHDNRISKSSVDGLIRKGLLVTKKVRTLRDSDYSFPEAAKKIVLNEFQSSAFDRIFSASEKNEFKTLLIHGVTGSGKTEVYITVIRKILETGKTAIVLVPEISLTPQLVHRFKIVFDDQVGVIHSKLSDGEKLDTYDRIVSGKFRIVIGARSAIFAPLKNIGIIIVDEEHDTSYKQENSPRYNARDAAIYRAFLNDAVAVLGSATPSVESYYNSTTGKYELLSLPSRVNDSDLPEIKIVDLSEKQVISDDEEKKDFFDTIDRVRVKFLSKELIFEIGQRLEKKQGIIILQNRRGYHSYLECLNCGNVEMCRRCSIALTYHKFFENMKCHYCGYSRRYTKVCTVCNSDKLIPKGAGTERVEEELKRIFPSAAIARMDSDTMTSGKIYRRVLNDFYEGKIDILAGTQMISKGLDFPNVTLVGVINADIGLLNPDFRATERTFQILTQVSGRSGRSVNKGEVIIQTNHSDFNVFADIRNHDYKNFYEKEILVRRQLNYPPFSRLIVIEARSEDKTLAEGKIKELFNVVSQLDALKLMQILPPHPPLFAKLKDKFRFHLLIKFSRASDASGNYMKRILKEVNEYVKREITKKVNVSVDVDAVNLM